MLEWIAIITPRKMDYLPWLMLAVAAPSQLSAQLVITTPTVHQVMQRNAAGEATFAVTAYAHYPYTSITATLVPLESGNQPQQYTFPPEQASQGFLHTTFTAATGWYRLKLTGTAPGITDSATVARVGVGEVFLVTGNSNAMGLPGLGARDASEHVVSFNATNKTLNNENITVAPDGPMPAPAFEVLKTANYIFPNGETSWYWGDLGGMLFERWRTPVLFFNAAWAAANAENYGDAASGKDAYNLYVGKYWPNRQPYSNIVNTMRYLTSVTGIRAVLWSHGENDAQLGFSETTYFNGIKTLITNSRKDSGYDIPWYMARNSASNSKPDPYLPVLDAQNRLIATPGFNVFHGPYLDTIQIPRPASGHFENVSGGVQGLMLAATAWNRSLSDTAIAKTIPLQPAYALHTGVTPARAYPNAAFDLPFQLNGNAPTALQVAAELLNKEGQFVATVGTGTGSPVRVKLPADLGNGSYHIRLVGRNPVMPGSVSQFIYVERAARDIEYVNPIGARRVGADVHVAWAIAPAPGLRQMVLQKTTDGLHYNDLQTFDTPAANQSGVYSFTDPESGNRTIFYRVKLAFADGATAYSTIVTLFGDGAPAPWTVFPNPVTQQQFFIMPSADTDITCRLFDAAGREHPIRTSAREAVGLVSVRPEYPLPSGRYILQISNAERTQNRHVVFY